MARPMVEPVTEAHRRWYRPRRPRRPSAACLTASRCSRMEAHQGSPGSAGVTSSSQARSESSSLARVRTSSRQAVGTGSPIGNSGVLRWVRDATDGVPVIVSVMAGPSPMSPPGSVWQMGWPAQCRRSQAAGAGGHLACLAARRAGPGRPAETLGWAATRARQGRSAAAVTPTLPVQATWSSGTGQPAVSSSGPRSRAAPLAQPARPRAWQRRAGPRARSRGRLAGRRACSSSMPQDRLAGPQQHRLGGPLGGADHVGAPVHPIGEVEVEVAGRAEHDRVAGGRAAVGVAGRVEPGPVVGLGLDQPDGAGRPRGPGAPAAAPAGPG